MRGPRTVFLFLALASSAQAQSSFTPATPSLPPDFVSLDCIPVRSSERGDRDPVYKIAVSLSLDDHSSPTNLTVVHHTISGAMYNRADQYTRSDLRQVPQTTVYYWTGARIRDPSLMMKGVLALSLDNKWTYGEELFKYGRREFWMISLCHIERPE
jgi:hypothetical protein